jgi:NADPH:quinone reductase-like Zn-dependent oxidoreductase
MGRIRPVLHTVLPLKEVPRGQEMMERNEVIGKIVYVPEGS